MVNLDFTERELEVLESALIYAGDRIIDRMIPEYLDLRDRIQETLNGIR